MGTTGIETGAGIGSSEGLMARLKVETQAMHDEAESQPFQRALVKGQLPREGYIASLEQLLLVHQALEGPLRALCDSNPAVAAAVSPEQFQEDYLLQDLAHLGRDPEAVRPTQAAAALVADIQATARREPVALLGYHYVLEGSNNGSRFIAKAVRRAYDLGEGPGTMYLDPYGERQRETWARFKAAMDAAAFPPDQADAIVEAAKRAFAGISAIYVELWRQVGATSG